MRNVGKSTIAQYLAKNHGFELVDLDEVFEQQEETKISEFVDTHGWKEFRSKEAKIFIQELMKNRGIKTYFWS